jgi:hypothetical protein
MAQRRQINMDQTPQTAMALSYAKQARDHAANLTTQLARALARIEKLEAEAKWLRSDQARITAFVNSKLR